MSRNHDDAGRSSPPAPAPERVDRGEHFSLSAFRPPSLAIPRLLLQLPSQLFERSGDAALIGSPDARGFDKQGFASDLPDCHPVLGADVGRNVFFPNVRLVSLRLLRHDVFTFKTLVRPSRHTMPIAIDGFGEKLVAVVRQAIDVDVSAFDRPEATASGFIAQITVAVCCVARIEHLSFTNH